jgi:hypothetical protein
MSDTLSKIRDKAAQQKPKYQDPLLSQLRAIAEGYWNRQGQIAREGSTLADIGRQQLQSGNPMGLVNLPLGAAAWLGSPAGALVPTSDEVYATDLPEWVKPGVAGTIATAGAFLPGPKARGLGRGMGELADDVTDAERAALQQRLAAEAGQTGGAPSAVGRDQALANLTEQPQGITAYHGSGSRGGEGGTSNYVIFDDSIITILKRYGIPFTLGAGGAAMVSGGDMPPELAAQMGPEA